MLLLLHSINSFDAVHYFLSFHLQIYNLTSDFSAGLTDSAVLKKYTVNPNLITWSVNGGPWSVTITFWSATGKSAVFRSAVLGN